MIKLPEVKKLIKDDL